MTLYRDGTQCRGRGVNVRLGGRSVVRSFDRSIVRSIDRPAAWPPPPGNRSRSRSRNRQPLDVPATGNRSKQPATATACLVSGQDSGQTSWIAHLRARPAFSGFSRFERLPGLIAAYTLKPLDTIMTSQYINSPARFLFTRTNGEYNGIYHRHRTARNR